MRIRKRWPAPSLAPPLELLQPPSDPPIQEVTPAHPHSAPPRSDLQLTLVKGSNGWICKTDDDDDDCMHSNSSSSTRLGEEALPNGSMSGKLNIAATVHADKDHSSGAEGSVEISSLASAATHLEMEPAIETSDTVKAKTNATWEVEKEVGSDMMRKKKKKKVDNDNAITEGLRCSRVNGRGWRCWKQTVEGHSLCAHHSTQGSTTRFKEEKQGHTALSSQQLILLDEEPLIMLKKRKKKIGMVKNRSLSGLLAQTEPHPAPPTPLLDSIAIL